MQIELDPKFVSRIRDCSATEDLGLDAYSISLIAGYLYVFQNKEAYKDAIRKSQNVEHQKRLIKPLINFARNTDKALANFMADPILSSRLLDEFQCKPVQVHHFKPSIMGAVLYVGDAEAPDDTGTALLELRGRLSMLIDALESINPESSPNKTNKRTQEARFSLVQNLFEIVKPFADEISEDKTCDKKTVASYIRDFLSLIDLNLTVKTICSYLPY
jgi:hypothetical protein